MLMIVVIIRQPTLIHILNCLNPPRDVPLKAAGALPGCWSPLFQVLVTGPGASETELKHIGGFPWDMKGGLISEITKHNILIDMNDINILSGV